MSTTELNGKQYTINAKDGGVLELVPVKPEVKGLWRPTSDIRYHKFWAIEWNGEARKAEYHWSGSTTDLELHDFGNCFPSLESAQKAAPLMARANKIIAAALQADPDAGVQSPERAFSAARRHVGEWYADNWNNHYDYGIACCVHTRKQADEMARILNEEGVK